MKMRLFSLIYFLLAGVAPLAMISSAANATSVTWRFQGNEYTGTGDHLAGEVTVTLDDADLWRSFHQCGTEMIINRPGRSVHVQGIRHTGAARHNFHPSCMTLRRGDAEAK